MKLDNSHNNTICTAGDAVELSRIRDFVKSKAEVFGFGDGDCNKIVLAVDEACSNLIEHAYQNDSTKLLCVEIDSLDKEFIIKILDNATPFDPLNVLQPDMEEYFKKLKRGGLGIKIMLMVMDEILYYPSTEQNPVNTLILKKHLN